MSHRPEIHIKISQDIIDYLRLENHVIEKSDGSYLKFVADADDIKIETNYLSRDNSVIASLNGVLLSPKPVLRKYSFSFRESRYEFILALEQLAIRSQRAYVNGDNTTYITLHDYVTPDYEDYISNEEPYSIRYGYIPIDEIIKTGTFKKIDYDDASSYFGYLTTTSKLQCSFYDVIPKY